MHKGQLVSKVAKETRLSQRIVSDVVKETLKQITVTLAENGQVTFIGFGTFYTRRRKESEARNFKNGKTIKVPAMSVAAFRAGNLLKQAVRKRK